jgi:hypothetical protein
VLTCRLTDKATAATRALERPFWIDALAKVLASQPDPERRTLFDVACCRVSNTHQLALRDRHAIVRSLAALVLPFE